MNNQIKLICTPLTFYTKQDEDLLFSWIKKVKSIKRFEGIGRSLYLYLESLNIPDNDLLNLMGIFERYGFDKNQLKVFMNQENKAYF